MIWLAGDDEPKIDYFSKMGIIEYYRLLDMKIEAAEKQAAENKKAHNRPGPKR